MTALLIVETAILAVLCILVAGLLRGYAAVLRRLHELDGGALPAAPANAPPFRTAAGVVEPARPADRGPRRVGRSARRRRGDPGGEIVSVRTVGVEQDTIMAFLSSSCEGCAGFWHELAEPGSWTTPAGQPAAGGDQGPRGGEPVGALAAVPARRRPGDVQPGLGRLRRARFALRGGGRRPYRPGQGRGLGQLVQPGRRPDPAVGRRRPAPGDGRAEQTGRRPPPRARRRPDPAGRRHRPAGRQPVRPDAATRRRTTTRPAE